MPRIMRNNSVWEGRTRAQMYTGRKYLLRIEQKNISGFHVEGHVGEYPEQPPPTPRKYSYDVCFSDVKEMPAHRSMQIEYECMTSATSGLMK